MSDKFCHSHEQGIAFDILLTEEIEGDGEKSKSALRLAACCGEILLTGLKERRNSAFDISSAFNDSFRDLFSFAFDSTIIRLRFSSNR